MPNLVTIHTGLYSDLAKRIAYSLFGPSVQHHNIADNGYRWNAGDAWYQHLDFTSDLMRQTIDRLNPYVQPDGELTFEIPEDSKKCSLSKMPHEKRVKWIADFARLVVSAKYDPATNRLKTPTKHPPIADWSAGNADIAFDFIHAAYTENWCGFSTAMPDKSITVGQLYRFWKALTTGARDDADLAGAANDPVETEIERAYREAVDAAIAAVNAKLVRLIRKTDKRADAVEAEAEYQINEIERERDKKMARIDDEYKQDKWLALDEFKTELDRLAARFDRNPAPDAGWREKSLVEQIQAKFR